MQDAERSKADDPASSELKMLLDVVARAIVDEPGEVDILVVHSGSTVVLELTVARGDVGKVIGRGGAMAGALRTILCNTATKYNKRAILEIIE
jgi:predicted RNA-binding protein YlqC (UPF0109 family)